MVSSSGSAGVIKVLYFDFLGLTEEDGVSGFFRVFFPTRTHDGKNQQNFKILGKIWPSRQQNSVESRSDFDLLRHKAYV